MIMTTTKSWDNRIKKMWSVIFLWWCVVLVVYLGR